MLKRSAINGMSWPYLSQSVSIVEGYLRSLTANFGSLIWRLTVKIFRFWRLILRPLDGWRLTPLRPSSNNNVAKVEFLCNAQEGLSCLLVYAELHSPPFRDRGNIQYLPLARIYPPYRNRGTEKN